jgi:hypothetical protein
MDWFGIVFSSLFIIFLIRDWNKIFSPKG